VKRVDEKLYMTDQELARERSLQHEPGAAETAQSVPGVWSSINRVNRFRGRPTLIRMLRSRARLMPFETWVPRHLAARGIESI
jgi:hypothetical protein